MVGSELQANTSNMVEAARAVVRVARMLEHASSELTLPQYRLLVMVASGDQRASKLAVRLALSKPTVTAVVEGLVERGYLTRSEVSGDRRAMDLNLTETGCQALAATDVAMAQRLASVMRHCDDPQLAESGLLQLYGAIERVVAARLADGGK
jgi:DNA-binding MarR family transcriptional regulator